MINSYTQKKSFQKFFKKSLNSKDINIQHPQFTGTMVWQFRVLCEAVGYDRKYEKLQLSKIIDETFFVRKPIYFTKYQCIDQRDEQNS